MSNDAVVILFREKTVFTVFFK